MSKCPGMSSKEAGKASACSSCPNQSTCSTKIEDPAVEVIKSKLVNHKKISIMSGKGGVGKSTVSKSFSQFLSKRFSVCLIDLDITGPSIPILCNSESTGVVNQISENFYSFVPHFSFRDTFLENDFEMADVLIFDTPPNVTQSHLEIAKYLSLDGVIIVTQPYFLSFNDCRRMIDFCKKAKFNILGVIVNMDGFICECGFYNESLEDGKSFCEKMDVKYLGSISLKQEIAMFCDEGKDLEIEEYKKIYKEIENVFE